MRHHWIAIAAVAIMVSGAVLAAGQMTTDAEFIKETYQNNLKEHAMAGLADAKASDKNVKEFASMLSKEHLKANEDLKAMAKKMNVELPDYKDEKSSYDKLSDLKGRAFDTAFLNWTIDSHTKELARFEAFQKTAKGDLKTFVDAQMPEIRSHLQKARSMSDNLTKGALRDVPVSERPIDVQYNPERVFNDETMNPDRTIPTTNDTGSGSKEFDPGSKFDSIDKWK
jgi:putative membrane protein